MTKKLSSKMQAKHLKKRSQRAAKAASPKRESGAERLRRERLSRYNNGTVASLLARGQAINGRPLTVDEVMAMINHTIEVNAGVGSVVETIEILEREHKLEITPELRELIDNFDSGVVRFNENAEVINMILQGEKDVSVLPEELLMDISFGSDALVTQICPAIMKAVEAHTELVNTYQKEHYPNQNYRQVMFSVALARLARIAPKYATPTAAVAEEVVCEDEADEINHTLDNREEV